MRRRPRPRLHRAGERVGCHRRPLRVQRAVRLGDGRQLAGDASHRHHRPRRGQVLIGEATGANTSLPGFTADVEAPSRCRARRAKSPSSPTRLRSAERRISSASTGSSTSSGGVARRTSPAAPPHPAPPTRRACRVTAPSPTQATTPRTSPSARRRRRDCPRIPATRPIRPTRRTRRTRPTHRPGGRCHRRRPGRRRCLAATSARRSPRRASSRRITRPAASTAT
jgi:hypothetical protein